MNICIPIENDQGLDSHVYGHFGSAPLFLVIDTETGACRTIANANRVHGHGMCQPVAALGGEKVDGIVVGGIGLGALTKLNAAGYRVFQANHATAKETVEAFRSGKLAVVSAEHACQGGHHGQGGCH